MVLGESLWRTGIFSGPFHLTEYDILIGVYFMVLLTFSHLQRVRLIIERFFERIRPCWESSVYLWDSLAERHGLWKSYDCGFCHISSYLTQCLFANSFLRFLREVSCGKINGFMVPEFYDKCFLSPIPLSILIGLCFWYLRENVINGKLSGRYDFVPSPPTSSVVSWIFSGGS